ncbi:MAG: cell division protein ZapA [Comamonas sp.]|jgi:cell division protein ZapA|uniref:cell division protein ZapA n=1 Tax=Comamonas sp. TaxID=34028 RepID=UPI00282BEF66|nr:cell division protein ZapA [Comamonas sp.]MDR0213770.1 cell division protein ZapA [Comamonas sp.]MDR2297193.1 cell division protein ZapA [Comamonas sp.]
MKQIDVQIMQQSYVLTCPDGQEERVMEAVRRVDEAMIRVRDSGKVRSRERVAVLAALNMAFDVLDRDAQLPQQSSAQDEDQTQHSEPPAATVISETELAEQQRQQELAEQLVLRLDQALENDARLL